MPRAQQVLRAPGKAPPWRRPPLSPSPAERTPPPPHTPQPPQGLPVRGGDPPPPQPQPHSRPPPQGPPSRPGGGWDAAVRCLPTVDMAAAAAFPPNPRPVLLSGAGGRGPSPQPAGPQQGGGGGFRRSPLAFNKDGAPRAGSAGALCSSPLPSCKYGARAEGRGGVSLPSQRSLARSALWWRTGGPVRFDLVLAAEGEAGVLKALSPSGAEGTFGAGAGLLLRGGPGRWEPRAGGSARLRGGSRARREGGGGGKKKGKKKRKEGRKEEGRPGCCCCRRPGWRRGARVAASPWLAQEQQLPDLG